MLAYLRQNTAPSFRKIKKFGETMRFVKDSAV